MAGETEAERDRLLFAQLVLTFENSAWQNLGKIVNPASGKVERNLELARNSIDMLDMIKRRTAGNLDEDELRFLEHTLYQLRINYVDEVEADKKRKEAETAGEKAGEPGENKQQT